MSINSITAIKAKHRTTIDDPYGFGVRIRVRRAGHKKALAAQQVDTGAQLALARELMAAQKRVREKGEEAPVAPGELALLDERFGAYLASTQQPDHDEIEEKAAAYVAGWEGEPFDEEHLPTNGAFALADVRKKFFGVFGGYDDDDVAVLPRYMEEEGGKFIDDEKVLTDVLELREEYAKELEALLAEPDRSTFEDAAGFLQAKVDWLSKEKREKRETAADKLREEHEAALSKIGVKETPFGGRPVREAMALVIIDAAVDLEKQYREDTGFLASSSRTSSASKGGRRKRTRTSKSKPARRRG